MLQQRSPTFIEKSCFVSGARLRSKTVMSHPSKVQFLQAARTSGYRTYLYFVATTSPELSYQRVQSRVQLGGHAVPEAKLVQRYERSLQLLPQAIRASDRAFIFDNSGDRPIKLAEWTPEQQLNLTIGRDELPDWFSRAVVEMLYSVQSFSRHSYA
jgi:predicted ABC-type ATPase